MKEGIFFLSEPINLESVKVGLQYHTLKAPITLESGYYVMTDEDLGIYMKNENNELVLSKVIKLEFEEEAAL